MDSCGVLKGGEIARDIGCTSSVDFFEAGEFGRGQRMFGILGEAGEVRVGAD